MKYLLISMVLMGCGPQYGWRTECDPVIQQTALLGCLERAKHPDLASAAANDAAEVVEECSDAAQKIACKYVRYCYDNCPGDK